MFWVCEGRRFARRSRKDKRHMERSADEVFLFPVCVCVDVHWFHSINNKIRKDK